MDARAVLMQGFGRSVVTEPADMAAYLTDWFRDATGDALAVLRPRDVPEVQEMVRECARLGLGIVPQGGNTGLVLGATRDASGTDITVVDPRAPDQGRMVMSFDDSPIALRQWAITTKTGQRTVVQLTELRTGVAIDPSLFNIELAAATYR